MPADHVTPDGPAGPNPWWDLPPGRPAGPPSGAPAGGTDGEPATTGTAPGPRPLPIARRRAHPAQRARRVAGASATLAGLFLTGFFAARGAAAEQVGSDERALGATPAAAPGATSTPARTPPTTPTTAAARPTGAPTATAPAAPAAPVTTTTPTTSRQAPVPLPRAGRTATPAVPQAAPRSSSHGS